MHGINGRLDSTNVKRYTVHENGATPVNIRVVVGNSVVPWLKHWFPEVNAEPTSLILRGNNGRGQRL